MINTKDITAVFNLHGDESYPMFFMDLFKDRFIANRKARMLNIRYIDEDMNRVWDKFNEKDICDENSYECLEARRLYRKIKNKKNIIDFHLTTANQDDCIICFKVNDFVLEIAKIFGIDYILILENNFDSLISRFENSISVEISKDNFIFSLSKIEYNIKKPNLERINKHIPIILKQICFIDRETSNYDFLSDLENFKDYDGVYYAFIGEKSYKGNFLKFEKVEKC